METGFFNFQDEENYTDFSLSLDHQHTLMDESHMSLLKMVDNDFNYVESLESNSNCALWETEQELNGDLAILPVSGVAEVIPKIENIKEDFAKVLTDWQEHIGYLQASEIEEDIDMVNLDMGIHLNSNSIDNIFENTLNLSGKATNNFVKYEESKNNLNNILSNHIKCDINHYKTKLVSEPDQCKTEIDILGLNSVGDVNFIIDFIQGRRENPTDTYRKNNSKTLGANTICIKHKPIDIILKKEQQNLVDEIFPNVYTKTINSEFLNNNQKKHSRKGNRIYSNKKSRRDVKTAREMITKFAKSQKHMKLKNFTELSSNSKNIPSTSQKVPVLQAVDVKSLLEQFEATETVSVSSQIFETAYKPLASNFPMNKSHITVLKKFIDSQDSKLYQDICNSLPKKVIDMIKVINNNSSSNQRVNELIKLDHDYCSNSNLFLSNNSSNYNNRNSNDNNSFEYNSKYTREINNSERFVLIKEKSYKKKDSYSDKSITDHIKLINYKVTLAGRPNWMDTDSKKNSSLEFCNTNDVSEEQHLISKTKNYLLQNIMCKATKRLNQASLKISHLDKSKISLLNKINVTPKKPQYEMKIQSALTSILELQKHVLTKTKSLNNHKPMKMISVLKKPPGMITSQKTEQSNLQESLIATKNSLSNQVQNIIRDAVDIKLFKEKEKKPPRRKLNLAEYRNRYEQNYMDGTHINSPMQSMVLVYIHHVSTNTQPINNSPDNPVWSEREIVSILRPKAEIEKQKLKSKLSTRTRGMQTTETVFGVFFNDHEDEDIKNQYDLDNHKDKKQKSIMDKFDKINVADIYIEKEIITDKLIDNEVMNNKTSERNIGALNLNLINKKEIAGHKNSLSRMRDYKHRNYKKVRVLSSPSRSRSRSGHRISVYSRSLSEDRENKNLYRFLNHSCIRSFSHSCNRCHNCNRSCSHINSYNYNFKHSRTTICYEEYSRRRNRIECMGLSRHRSHSIDRSCARCPVKRRTISHRRGSVSSSSSLSSRSRSHSRSSPIYRFYSRSRSSSSRSRSSRYSSCSRSPLPSNRRSYDEWYFKEKQRQVEERRVIYVGQLKEGITKTELRRRFENFGPVIDISMHFRERGHNYGFVTFAYKSDAYEAVEHGNDDPSLPRYDLCFGGRRAFCKVKYADLDGAAGDPLEGNRSNMFKPQEENTFDLLLKEAQNKLRKRKF